MNKKVNNILRILALSVLFITPLSINAQNALGCDGKRYVQDVFTDTTHAKSIPFGKNLASTLGASLLMDVVEPKGDVLAKRPLIILAFGGGFVTGARNEQYMLEICKTYTKKGFVCATIDYRLYDFAKGFPDSLKITNTVVQAIHDMKAAIRFFRKNAGETNTYRIDTANIIVGGVSAGAITAMHVAALDSTDTMPTWLRNIVKTEGGFEGNAGTPGYSTAVKGVLSLSGGLYQKEFLDKNDPPFFAYHGTKDDVVPFGYGLNVYKFYTDGDSSTNAYARSLGIKSSLITVQGGGHTDIYNPLGAFSSNLTDYLNKSALFMKQLVCGESITLPTQELNDQAVKVYPNPSYDAITVQFDKNHSFDATNQIGQTGYRVMVFDALGRQVFNSNRQYNETFNLYKKDMGAGIYFAHILTGEQTIPIIKKIIFE